MSGIQLSEGVLATLMQGGQAENPIVQILGCKKIVGNESADRYRLLLSDGKWLISFAMLASQINDQVGAGKLVNNTVIRITRHITSTLQNSGRGDKRVLVILDLDVLANGNDVGMKLGDPKPLTNTDTATNNKTPVKTPTNSAASTTNSRFNNSSNTSAAAASTSASTSQFKPDICHPIESLSPYNMNWVIKARVMTKSPIRTWSNSRGDGKLFSMELCDESSEIKVTAFNDECDRFYDLIVADKVYYFTGGQIKVANKQFNFLKHDYEITLGRTTEIKECHDVCKIPDVIYNFVPIGTISKMEAQTSVDILAVCKDVTDIQRFTSKAGKDLIKRDVTLVDQSQTSINLTLWGAEAENFDGSNNPVLALKGVRIGEYMGGRTLSTVSGTMMKRNPDIPEAHALQGWVSNSGLENVEIQNISGRIGDTRKEYPFSSFKQIRDDNWGNSPTGDYFRVIASIMLIKSDGCVYRACPAETCNKKIVDLNNGLYRCEKCMQEYPNFKYRLIMSMNLSDWTGNSWVTCFAEEAEKILGKTSQEIGELLDNDKQQAVEYIASRNFQKRVFRCRVKMESYNDESRLKTVVMSSEKLNFEEINQMALDRVSELTGFVPN